MSILWTLKVELLVSAQLRNMYTVGNGVMTDTELQRLMFYKESSVSKSKRMPDYNYIHKELLRNGVSKKLLWIEHMEDCRANGDEPLMYSQFCY